jgi:hypothetical protein
VVVGDGGMGRERGLARLVEAAPLLHRMRDFLARLLAAGLAGAGRDQADLVHLSWVSDLPSC